MKQVSMNQQDNHSVDDQDQPTPTFVPHPVITPKKDPVYVPKQGFVHTEQSPEKVLRKVIFVE